MALNLRFLQKSGVDTAVGTSGIGLNAVAGIVVHVIMVVTFVVWAGRSTFDSFDLPDPKVLLYGLAGVVVVAVVALAIRGVRDALVQRLLPVLKRSVSGLLQVLRSPVKIAMLLGGSAIVTLSYVVAVYVATLAFGGDLAFAQVAAVYLLGAAVATAAPTPGGLGALEAAVIAGLVAAGMDNTVAVPAVFLYRLATFWLPILPGWLCFGYLQRQHLV
jgi:undecaprenyl-diphosphatase